MMKTHAHVARDDTRRRRSTSTSAVLTLASLALGAAAGCGGSDTSPQGGRTAPGAERSTKTAALETGADLMQDGSPVGQISMYLVGFHPSKDDASLQMESHHYCDQVNEDFAQCVLYDGNGDAARMHGIEYIISERLYATLAKEERAYWHPHNYEILSGTLRMPGLPDVAEKEAMQGKVNSYGKTWHVWMTGVHGRPADSLPLGPAHLAWSFNHDGEAYPEMVADRDRRMGLSSSDARADRAELAPLAKPQGGVNAVAELFPNASGAPAGVEDSGISGTEPVPIVTLRPPR
ncbi:MAG TPA: OBAP family protein [Gemmatimonadales bacterium]